MTPKLCINEGCPRRLACGLGNPASNAEATHDVGDWYIAGPNEDCLSYEPAPLVMGGQGRDRRDLEEAGAAVWGCVGVGLAVRVVIAIGVWLGW